MTYSNSLSYFTVIAKAIRCRYLHTNADDNYKDKDKTGQLVVDGPQP